MERRERELRERDAYAVRRDAALAVFDALPADVQAAIRERAARGPMGLTLSAESPLFLQRVVAEVEQLTLEAPQSHPTASPMPRYASDYPRALILRESMRGSLGIVSCGLLGNNGNKHNHARDRVLRFY